MPDEKWDSNLYVDEAIGSYRLQRDQLDGRHLELIGAGVGIKDGNVELVDWRGISYYKKAHNLNNVNVKNGSNKNNGNGSNGNGYWLALGGMCLDMLLHEFSDLRPDKIYICNQIAFYVMQAAATTDVSSTSSSKKLRSMLKNMRPVTHREYRGYNGVYRAKQAVGKMVSEKLKVKIFPEDAAKILEGRLYDVRNEILI